MDEAIPARARKGRGAIGNPKPRFDRAETLPIDDGWPVDPDEAELPPPRTEVARDASRSIIAYNASPDIPFDRSINPYRGCEHGCVYCFARPSHAFLGLSPGLDFETKLTFKPQAAALLEAELAAKTYLCRPIALGTNTDPYQPVERRLKITRSILEVLARCRHPVTIVTKSALVARDLDILAPMAAEGLARIAISVTTLDTGLARYLEPRAAVPSRRLAAIAQVAAAGVPVAVMAAPMIPALNDHELEAILAGARDAGARYAGYVALRLPHELKALFEEWLRTHVPDRADRVLAAIREMRGGKLNDARFGARFRGEGVRADLLAQRFRNSCRRLGLDSMKAPLDTSRFVPPVPPGAQYALL